MTNFLNIFVLSASIKIYTNLYNILSESHFLLGMQRYTLLNSYLKENNNQKLFDNINNFNSILSKTHE